jgi:hypothetical protein
LNPTWDGPHLSSVDEDEALEHGIVFRPSEDE